MRTLGGYLSLSFLASLGLLAIVGCQSRIKAAFWKGTFHAFLFSLCLAGLFGVLLPLVGRCSLSDMGLMLYIALAPFAILCPTADFSMPMLLVLWAVYLALMGASLSAVRKAAQRRTRIIGHILVFVAFATIYAVAWYFTARAVMSALAAIAIYSM